MVTAPKHIELAVQRVILNAFWHKGVKDWRPWLAAEIARRVGDRPDATAARLTIMARSGVVALDKITASKNTTADTIGSWRITDKGISLLAALNQVLADAPAEALEGGQDARKPAKRPRVAESASAAVAGLPASGGAV